MSFLSALGHIGDIVTDFIPGVGAAKKGIKLASKIAGAAGDVGSVIGKQEAGEADGRLAQANLGISHDRNAIDLFQAQQGAQNQAGQLDLERKGFADSHRGSTAKQALIGALLGGGVAPTDIGGGKRSGGLFAALQNNPDALAAMQLLGKQGAEAQAAPVQFTGGEILKAPTLTPMQQIDQGGIMSTLAKVGQIAGAASPYLKPQEDYSLPGRKVPVYIPGGGQ